MTIARELPRLRRRIALQLLCLQQPRLELAQCFALASCHGWSLKVSLSILPVNLNGTS